MRILIAIVAGILAGLAVRMFTHPTVQEITAPAPSYEESHAQTVAMAEANVAAAKPQPELPLNPAYTEPLTVRGYIVKGQRVNVVLSDGTMWTETTGGLEAIQRSHVVFRGKAYAIRGAADGGMSKAQAVLAPSPTGGQNPPSLAAFLPAVVSGPESQQQGLTSVTRY